MTGPERASVTLGGLESSYLRAGDPSAPAVVLLHDGAWGGSADGSWREVIGPLAEEYRVIAPDLYGYGRSSKMVQLDVAPYEFRLRQVAGLIDALQMGSVHLVGNSFGGAMALRAVTRPWFAWRVRSAISIAGTGGPFRTRRSLEELARFDGTRADMMRIVRLLTGEFDGIDAYVDRRLADASNPGHFRAVAAAGLATPFASGTADGDAYPQSLGLSAVPLALVAGSLDELVEPGWARSIAEHAAHCTVYEMEARHSPNISHPAETARLLSEVLGRHEASR